MKLTMCPSSLNGQTIEKNQFGYVLKPGLGFEPAGIDSIQFHCRGNRKAVCSVDLTLGPQIDSDENKRRRWHWDGNMQAPTITPSIGCDAKCGWHGHITSGEIAP